MANYREMLFKLAQTLNCDKNISVKDRTEINKAYDKLLGLLWKYDS